jgi:hypothetical protein
MNQLGCLLLQDTKVSDTGLAHLKGLESVSYLWLENTGVSDAGLEHLKGLPKLRSLGLGGTKVTDAGVKALQKALPKCQISNDPESAKRARSQAKSVEGR